VHATPQLPQWDESFWKSEVDLHVLLQQTLPPVHELLQESTVMQFPATQRLPPVHLVPQVPQLSESTRRSEGDLHVPLQQTLPPVHELLQESTVLHCPPTQRLPPVHLFAQVPQLSESVRSDVVVKHCPLQQMRPVPVQVPPHGSVVTQAPPRQDLLPVHLVPQVPQLFLSVRREAVATQAPEQHVSVALH